MTQASERSEGINRSGDREGASPPPRVAAPAPGTSAGQSGVTSEGDDITSPTDLTTPASDSAMTRSEERLLVGVRRRATERVRLRKVIVTEEVTQTVELRREELRIEREPIDERPASDSADDEPYEIVLYAERPVVHTEVVPVERVWVSKETVTEQVAISEDVRSEQIETTIEDSEHRTPTG